MGTSGVIPTCESEVVIYATRGGMCESDKSPPNLGSSLLGDKKFLVTKSNPKRDVNKRYQNSSSFS